jgi:type II secretory pathway pseudopilin PulG
MVRRLRQYRRGFTLLETILATVILCAVVIVVGATSSRAMNSTNLNRQYETARQIADRQLTIIDYIGINEFLTAGTNEGVLTRFGREYKWQVMAEKLELGNLYSVEVIVSWVEHNHQYNVSVGTMLNSSDLLLELEPQN